jgi:cyclopropane fatty-acyl-phospholipid synthase-like methyltransferase
VWNKTKDDKVMTEWDRILHEEWYRREEPDDVVLDFAHLLTKKNQKIRVLDLGCGAGRHLIYMARQGFEAYGTDISETGLNFTKVRLRKEGLEGYLVKADMMMLPYRESFFDAIISLHAIYHQKLKGLQGTILEIHRILNNNGHLLVNFLTKRTYSYGKGTKVEKDTFVEQGGTESGVLHHFSDEEEIKRILSKFKIANLKLVERKFEGKLRSRWIALAVKV